MILFKNLRFYIIALAIILSFLVYFFVVVTIPLEQLQIIRLTQFYALIALLYLYITIFANPFCTIFKDSSFQLQYRKAQPALAVSAFYFGLLHAYFAFFGQLGGFDGLGFLSDRYLFTISISFTALIILFFLTISSLDYIGKKLPPLFLKVLHGSLYIAGLLILIHAVMIGTHFQKLNEFIPQIIFTAVAILLLLEILRLDTILKRKLPDLPQASSITVPLFTLLVLGVIYFLVPIPKESGISFGIHSQHIQLAKQSQQNNLTGSTTNGNTKIPGLQGDPTKRFTVSFNNPSNVQPGQDSSLTFQVYDASSGNKARYYQKINEKIAHFIIVDNNLQYFNHIHPEQRGNEFTITTQFPKPGRYHLYLDFQPLGAIEQQMAFTIDVGNVDNSVTSSAQPDKELTKTFGKYEVTLTHPKPLKSSQLSVGEQLLTYSISDAQTKKPITTLKPYLAAFGHVVMINTKTFDYIHVHPNDLTVPKPNQNGGPKVEFMPLGLYGPITPGIYRVFGQFNPNNELFTSDFTIKIELN